MRYTYKGNSYEIVLSQSGQIKCEALGIEAATTDEVQALIRKHVEAEKSVKAEPILTFGDGYRKDQYRYFEGKAKPVNVGNVRWPQVWISWKEDNRNQRGKFSLGNVYRDTPENRATMDAIVDLNKQIRELETERDRLFDTLETLSLKGEMK